MLMACSLNKPVSHCLETAGVELFNWGDSYAGICLERDGVLQGAVRLFGPEVPYASVNAMMSAAYTGVHLEREESGYDVEGIMRTSVTSTTYSSSAMKFGHVPQIDFGFRSKCPHCGQWGEVKSECEYCGGPVD